MWECVVWLMLHASECGVSMVVVDGMAQIGAKALATIMAMQGAGLHQTYDKWSLGFLHWFSQMQLIKQHQLFICVYLHDTVFFSLSLLWDPVCSQHLILKNH